jgi:hypothetical protein
MFAATLHIWRPSPRSATRGNLCESQVRNVSAGSTHVKTTLTYLLTYLLTHSLTPLFEKLIVTQPVKKYPAFLWNPKVHYRVHISPPLDPLLSQPNPVRTIDPCLPKVQLNVILPPTPSLPSGILPLGFPTKTLLTPLSSPMRATCPAYLNLLDLITLTIYGEQYRL